MKWRCVILKLILYIRNGWHAHFHDKRRRARFHDGRRPRFCDKRRHTPRNTCLLSLHNRRRAIGTSVSLLSQKQSRLGYKLNWYASKRRSSPFFPPPSQFHSSMMQARLIFPDQRWSHLRTSLIYVSDLSFLRSDRANWTVRFRRIQWQSGALSTEVRAFSRPSGIRVGGGTRTTITLEVEVAAKSSNQQKMKRIEN
jgi:hypothetical protein